MKKVDVCRLVAAVLAVSAGAAGAKVSDVEAARLGKQLTACGAEVAGNKDGSIPAWSGKVLGLPAGLKWDGDGTPLPDMYAGEKPLFVIDAANYQKYKDHLSEGQLALFAKYPESFRMPVYPTHRDGRYYPAWEQKCVYNASHVEMSNGIEGIANYSGSVPFPMPQNGPEVIWNARVTVPYYTLMGVADDIGVFANGSYAKRKQELISEYPYANPNLKIGTPMSDTGVYAGYVLVNVLEPERDKGRMTLVHEPLDYVSNPRNAWVYVPGTRRVRRAPTVGYDTPDGPGGLMTVDDMLGFNGAMDRYDWKLVGKKEMYIPYHDYKFDDPTAKYSQLLPKGHVNPNYMRYELHRVWVVEANLKPGARHIYAKRRFYIDEDSWIIAASDAYDGRGELWRASMVNSVYHYGLKGYMNRSLIYHDLRASHYVATRLINEIKPYKLMLPAKGLEFYDPENLRKMGVR